MRGTGVRLVIPPRNEKECMHVDAAVYPLSANPARHIVFEL
jgi:hypothetical protein